MGKGKLAKFADMAEYPHVFEYPYSVADEVPFEMKGHWSRVFFYRAGRLCWEKECQKGKYGDVYLFFEQILMDRLE